MVITAATIVIMKMPSPLLHSTDTSYVIAIMILTRNLGQLTYLLQNSLSGNSKTLMILNLSPLAAHLGESLTSLRFATKVNNTTIGTAKKQLRGSG